MLLKREGGKQRRARLKNVGTDISGSTLFATKTGITENIKQTPLE